MDSSSEDSAGGYELDGQIDRSQIDRGVPILNNNSNHYNKDSTRRQKSRSRSHSRSVSPENSLSSDGILDDPSADRKLQKLKGNKRKLKSRTTRLTDDVLSSAAAALDSSDGDSDDQEMGLSRTKVDVSEIEQFMAKRRSGYGKRFRQEQQKKKKQDKQQTVLPTGARVSLIPLDDSDGDDFETDGVKVVRPSQRPAYFPVVGGSGSPSAIQPRSQLTESTRRLLEASRRKRIALRSNLAQHSQEIGFGADEVEEEEEASVSLHVTVFQETVDDTKKKLRRLKVTILRSDSIVSVLVGQVLALCSLEVPAADCILKDNIGVVESDKTAEDLGLTDGQELELVVPFKDVFYFPEEDAPPSKEDKIKLLVRFADKRTKKYAIAKNAALSELMNKFATFIGHNLDELKFEFDGDKIQVDETPEGLDMEDDDIIDVSLRR